MRTGRGLAAGKFRRMWIVAIHANFAVDGAHFAVPIAARPAMHARFPIAIGRTVATAAQKLAVREGHLMAVAGLQQCEVVLIVAIETVVVPPMAAVSHHNIGMFLRHDQVLVRIKPQRRWFVFFVAGVAVEIRQVCTLTNKIRVRFTDCGRIEKIGVYQWNRRPAGAVVRSQDEHGGQHHKKQNQASQYPGRFCAICHNFQKRGCRAGNFTAIRLRSRLHQHQRAESGPAAQLAYCFNERTCAANAFMSSSDNPS